MANFFGKLIMEFTLLVNSEAEITLTVNGTTIPEEHLQTDYMNTYLYTIGQKLANSIPHIPPTYNIKTHPTKCLFELITLDETLTTLRSKVINRQHWTNYHLI